VSVAQQQPVSSTSTQSADESLRLFRLTGTAVFVCRAGEQSPALYFFASLGSAVRCINSTE
jgi:hypothetical protein